MYQRLLIAAISLFAASLARPAAAADTRPIVAVFSIQASDELIAPAQRSALTDFLAARLAATGRFRTVPRSQIKRRLTALRKESYRDCYDQTCQIEIGRELAASKALSTRVIAVDDRCELTLELFDLASATSEAAHTAGGACDAGPLFASVSAAVDALVGKLGATSTPAANAAANAAQDQVSLYVRSEPSGVEVLIDGLHRGATPMDVPVARGRRLALTLRKDGYQLARRTVVANDVTELMVPMRLTPAGRFELAATSEWFGIGLGPGHAEGLGSGIGVQVRMAAIKGRYFFWTLFEFNVLVATGAGGSSKPGAINIGTRAGYPIYLGTRGQHQLLPGLGVGYAKLFDGTASSADDRSVFMLTPGLDYIYNTFDGAMPVGFGVRVGLPAAGDLAGDYPWTVMLTANIGLSLYPFFKGAVARRRGR